MMSSVKSGHVGRYVGIYWVCVDVLRGVPSADRQAGIAVHQHPLRSPVHPIYTRAPTSIFNPFVEDRHRCQMETLLQSEHSAVVLRPPRLASVCCPPPPVNTAVLRRSLLAFLA